MILFENQKEFKIENINEIEKTVSTLLIPERLVPEFQKKRMEEFGNNTAALLRILLYRYRILTHSGMLPKPRKIKTEYQEENQNLKRVSFRPHNADWVELGGLAVAFGKSRCWMFTFLLSLDLNGLWKILSEAFTGEEVPTSESLELIGFASLRRFFYSFARGYHVKI